MATTCDGAGAGAGASDDVSVSGGALKSIAVSIPNKKKKLGVTQEIEFYVDSPNGGGGGGGGSGEESESIVVLLLHASSGKPKGGANSKATRAILKSIRENVPRATVLRPEAKGTSVPPRAAQTQAFVRAVAADESGVLPSGKRRKWLIVGYSFGTRVASAMMSDISAWLPDGDELIGGLLVAFPATNGSDFEKIRDEPTRIEADVRLAFIRGTNDKLARASEFDGIYDRVSAKKRRWDIAADHGMAFDEAMTKDAFKNATSYLMSQEEEEDVPDAKRQKKV